MDVSNDYLDAYVFLHSRASWLEVCQLWKDKVVRFAGQNISGPDEIVAFVEQAKGDNDDHKLREKIDRVKKAANPSSSSAKATKIGLAAPSRWSDKKRHAAHVRITANEGMAETVFETLYPRGPDPLFRLGHGYNGHALCEGDWSVLLELGADSAEELNTLIGRLDRVSNIASTIVTTLLMQKHQPKAPEKCEPWT